MKYRVTILLDVKEAKSKKEAIELASDFFCGGDYYWVVNQVGLEAEEIHEEASQLEAGQA